MSKNKSKSSEKTIRKKYAKRHGNRQKTRPRQTDRHIGTKCRQSTKAYLSLSLFSQNEKDFKDYLFGGVHFTCVNLRIQTRHRLFVEQTYHLDPKSILAKQNAETAEIVSDGGLSRQSVLRQTDKQATAVLQCTVGVVCKTDGRTYANIKFISLKTEAPNYVCYKNLIQDGNSIFNRKC